MENNDNQENQQNLEKIKNNCNLNEERDEKYHKQIENDQINKIENGEYIIDMQIPIQKEQSLDNSEFNQIEQTNKKSEELDEKVNPDKNENNIISVCSSMFDFIEVDKIINNLKDQNSSLLFDSDKNEMNIDVNKINPNLETNITHLVDNIQISQIENNENIQKNDTPKNNISSSQKFSTPIKLNTNIGINKIDSSYESLFRSYTASPLKTKKSSLTINDLTKDENLFFKKSSISIAQKDEYIKIEDWDFLDDIIKLEENFNKVESKINKTDLYNLFNTIKKCDVYSPKAANPKNDNQRTVGPVSTLEYMVESTFGFDKNSINHITEHIISLEKYLFRWRLILGDGNCYYRAIMFAFLENIIFEKNILLLKNIIGEINQKFDESYFNMRNLHINNQKEILSINKNLILKILYIIYEILDNSGVKNSNQNAYEILIKCFLYCDAFDQGMVMYFRFKIYEFIKLNRNNIYTKDFSIKIGNLLPSEYETEYGDFLYDKFYEEQLMKMDTDAEKIVIYLTPFVLKLNVKILIYEFDKDSSVLIREFPCYLNDRQNINLLYRKTHYDLIYEMKYFENYTKELCYYVNLEENLRVVNNGVLDKIREKGTEQINNMNDLNNIPENISTNSSSLTSNSMSKFLSSIDQIQNKTNNISPSLSPSNNYQAVFPVCISCKNSYLHQPNILGLCLICVNTELSNNIMANYLIFINECLAEYEDDNEQKIPKIFNEIFNVRQYSFYDKLMALSRLASFSNKPLKDFIKEVKNKICVICTRNLSTSEGNHLILFKLPCNCVICCKECLKIYFSLVFNKKKLERNGALCICGYQFNNQDYKLIYAFIEKNKFKDMKKILECFAVASISRVCVGGCMEDYRYSQKEFHSLRLKDAELTKIYKIKEFKHVICEECYHNRKIKEKENIECVLCNSTHKVDKIKKYMSNQEDECIIL